MKVVCRKKVESKRFVCRQMWTWGLFLCLFASSCTFTDALQRTQLPPPQPLTRSVTHAFHAPVQQTYSDLVHSVQLTRKGVANSMPVIRLNSSDKLELRFDLLTFDSKDLRVRFVHMEPDWTPSNQPETFFMEGFYQQKVGFGEISTTARPSYRSYSYIFPNRDARFLLSGNYMLEVEDRDTGQPLFTRVFYVTENLGEIRSSVEKRMSRDDALRRRDYPVSLYHLPENPSTGAPDLLENPAFNLKFFFVQNGFLGQAVQAEELDFSMDTEVQFELRQERPFIGDMEFLRLPLSQPTIQSAVIAETNPAEVPPKIALFEDAQGFSASLSRPSSTYKSEIRYDPEAMYAEVFFRLDPREDLHRDARVYVVGGFNDWEIREMNRMEYDAVDDRWIGSAVIKEGNYAYKYVLVQDGEVIATAFDDLFTRTQQEYTAFVYFRDPDRFYHRLLQVQSFQ